MAESNVAGSADDSATSSTAVALHKGSLSTSGIGNDLLIEKINHISSFIRVLKARILFMFSGLMESQQRSRSITGDTSVSDYKENLEEYVRKVEQIELHSEVFNSAIHSVEMGEYLNKSKEEIVKIVTDNTPAEEKQILDNFVDIVETTNSIIQDTVELQECHRKIIKSKQEYIQKLEEHRVLREQRLAVQNTEESPNKNNIAKLENMLQKKVDNLNIMRGIILSILTSPFLNIDFTEHPELLEISKRRRKIFTL